MDWGREHSQNLESKGPSESSVLRETVKTQRHLEATLQLRQEYAPDPVDLCHLVSQGRGRLLIGQTLLEAREHGTVNLIRGGGALEGHTEDRD